MAAVDTGFLSTATIRLASLAGDRLNGIRIEERFDRLARLACAALRCPIAVVAALEGDRLVARGSQNWPLQAWPLKASFCGLALESPDGYFASDVARSPRWQRHPLVTGPLGVRSYAGQSFTDQRGTPFGVVSVYGLRPNEFTLEDHHALRDLAALAHNEITTRDLCHAQAQLLDKLDAARQAALIDPLTRVWNRRGASALLARTFAAADRHGTPTSVLVVDVNQFKAINDTHGHPAGDRALQLVARTILRAMRDEDAVCRIGGDEFLAILANVDGDAATTSIARLHATLRDATASSADHSGVPGPAISVSVGAATRAAGSGIGPDRLIEMADARLYEAKAARAGGPADRGG